MLLLCIVLMLKSSLMPELQIRWIFEDISEIISLFRNENICCDPLLEPSLQDGSNDGS